MRLIAASMLPPPKRAGSLKPTVKSTISSALLRYADFENISHLYLVAVHLASLDIVGEGLVNFVIG